MKQTVQRKRFLEIDAIRGIIAVWVVLFHLFMSRGPMIRIINFGLLSVDLFFIISGFVIVMSVERVSSVKEFLLRRFSRLFPTYWFCILLTASCMLISEIQPFSRHYLITIVANFSMLQPYFFKDHIDASYWSMVVEMCFYVFILLVAIGKKIRYLEFISVGLLLPTFIFGYYLTHFASHDLLWAVYRRGAIFIFFPLFTSGIIFYKLKTEGHKWWRYLFLVLCILTQYNFHHIDARLQFMNYNEYAVVLVMMHIVFWLACTGKLGFIVNKLTIFLGDVSYPLYLLHQFISVNILMPFLMKFIGFKYAVLVDIGLVVFLAFLINNYLSVPAERYIRNKWIRPSGGGLLTVDGLTVQSLA